MREKPAMDDNNNKRDDDGDFLPDLCGPQPVLVLVLVSELLVGALVVAAYGVERFDWARFGMVSMLTQWVVLTSAGALCSLRPLLRRMPQVAAGLLSYAITLLNTLLFSLMVHWVSYGNSNDLLDVLVGNLMVAAVLSGITLRYLYLQQQLRNQQKAEMLARIQALQSRIRPHFLFNSMNTIASLIAVDQDSAERMVVELSHLFRASLSEPGLIPLAKEVDLCQYYIDIEQIRLGDRLAVEWQFRDASGAVLDEADAELQRRQIPSFMLQPLVENAIYHGIQPLPGGGTIRLAVTLAARETRIDICNPVAADDDRTEAIDRVRGNGIALENIRHRLSAYYNGAGSLAVDNKDNEFAVTLRYPG